MRILLASSEVFPYSKTGGLADAAGALGKALAQAGCQVGIVTPMYRGIREKFYGLRRMEWHFDFPLGDKYVGGEVWTHEPTKGVTIYFVHHPHYFDRPGIYNEGGVDYADNGERFIYLSKCAVHLARYLPWRPSIVHASDWQTGLVPLLVQHQGYHERWLNPPRTCLTIHNLAYQGYFPASTYALTNLPLEYLHNDGAQHFGQLNCLKAGINFANVVTTVSPRYAREITTEEYGETLDPWLRARQGQGRLIGILNGVDYEEWNTTANRSLKAPYSVRNLRGKAINKAALQKEFNLPVNSKVPLFGTVTRLADQKGVDIELAALEEMLAADMQFVLLGSGAKTHEEGFKKLAARFPEKVGLRIGYDHGLSHRIEAGCDFYIMPSRFEPCGLNQMYSLRYGTIPIVRRTGGLDDSVVDANDSDAPTGIKFTTYSAQALSRSIRKALILSQDAAAMEFYRKHGMKADFSWDGAVNQYKAAYETAQV